MCFVGLDPTQKKLELSGGQKTFTVKLVDGGKLKKNYSTYDKYTVTIKLAEGNCSLCCQSPALLFLGKELINNSLDCLYEELPCTLQVQSEKVTYKIFIENKETKQPVGEPLTVHWKQ